MRSPTHEPIRMMRPPCVHVLERRLRCDEGAAQVDVDHAVELLDRRLLEFLWDGRAGVVDEHIELAQ